MEFRKADFSNYKIPRLPKGTTGPSTSMEHRSPLDAPSDKRRQGDNSQSRGDRFTPNRHPIGKAKNLQPKPPVDDNVARTLARVVAMIKAGRRPGDSDGGSPAPTSSSSSGRSHSSNDSGSRSSHVSGSRSSHSSKKNQRQK